MKFMIIEFHSIIEGLPKNIEDIIFYGFTEMVNNAIDHSEGKNVQYLSEGIKTVFILL